MAALAWSQAQGVSSETLAIGVGEMPGLLTYPLGIVPLVTE